MIFVSTRVLGQGTKKVYFDMKDTLSLSKANNVIYHNETPDTIFVNVSVYDAKTKNMVIENLFNKGFKGNYAMTALVKRLKPNSMLAEAIPANKFVGYKMKKGEYLFKAVFDRWANNKSTLVAVFQKHVFVR